MKYVLKISYDGESFNGFQRQPNVVTVQGRLEQALSKLFCESIELVAAGRTDTGVHGIGQVIAFDSQVDRPLKGVVEGVNGRLGDSISISEAALLPDDSQFHPRFAAQARTYHYLVLSDCHPSAHSLWGRRMWCLRDSLEHSRISQACEVFLGEHDFTTFTSRCDMPSYTRTVLEFSARPTEQDFLPGKLWRIEVRANAFLRKMVRLMVAAVVESGIGLLSPDDVRKKLKALEPDTAPHPAPPSGLYFADVQYEPDPFSTAQLALQTYRARPRRGFIFKG